MVNRPGREEDYSLRDTLPVYVVVRLGRVALDTRSVLEKVTEAAAWQSCPPGTLSSGKDLSSRGAMRSSDRIQNSGYE